MSDSDLQKLKDQMSCWRSRATSRNRVATAGTAGNDVRAEAFLQARDGAKKLTKNSPK
jgi:hypothetical protein